MDSRPTLRFLLNLEFIAPRTKILGAICLSYLLELLFTLFELDDSVSSKWHPFYEGHRYQNGTVWDGWVTPVVFWYGLLEMLARSIIFLAAYWAALFKFPFRIFLVCSSLELIDMLDYWLFRNGEWFGLGTVWEFNYLKIFVIFAYAWKEYNQFGRKSIS